MAWNVSKSAKRMHKAFADLFRDGAEHRPMMHSEASAAILQVASRCIEILKSLGKNSNYTWSNDMIQNADHVKNVVFDEYRIIMGQWRHESAIEKVLSMRNALYPRIILADASEFQKVVEEEATLMEIIDGYNEMSKISRSKFSSEELKVRVMHSEAVAFQIVQVACMLIGIVDKKASENVRRQLERPISNSRQLFLGIATDMQKFEILSKLQEEQRLDAKEVLLLSKETFYVISHGMNTGYCGFFLVDRPLHVKDDTYRSVWISHFEVDLSRVETSTSKAAMDWIKTNARENGFRMICSKSLKPTTTFWLDNDFVIQACNGIAVFSLDPMSIEYIVSRA